MGLAMIEKGREITETDQGMCVCTCLCQGLALIKSKPHGFRKNVSNIQDRSLRRQKSGCSRLTETLGCSQVQEQKIKGINGLSAYTGKGSLSSTLVLRLFRKAESFTRKYLVILGDQTCNSEQMGHPVILLIK